MSVLVRSICLAVAWVDEPELRLVLGLRLAGVPWLVLMSLVVRLTWLGLLSVLVVVA